MNAAPQSPSSRRQLRPASTLGMGPDLRHQLSLLSAKLQSGPLSILGPLSPNPDLNDHFRHLGAREIDPSSLPSSSSSLVIPPLGFSSTLPSPACLDLTLPCLRRSRLTLTTSHPLRRVLVAAPPHDPATLHLLHHLPHATLVDSPDAASRLAFSPQFLIIHHPLQSPHLARCILQTLHERHPDSQYSLIETTDPFHLAREKALERLRHWADLVVVAGTISDPSVRALIEASSRLGLHAVAATHRHQIPESILQNSHHIALSAGEFILDSSVQQLAKQLIH